MARPGRFATFEHRAEPDQPAPCQGRDIFLAGAVGQLPALFDVVQRVIAQVRHGDRLNRVADQVAHLEERGRSDAHRQPMLGGRQGVHGRATQAGVLKPVQGHQQARIIHNELSLAPLVRVPDHVLFACHGLPGGAKIHRRIDRCLRRPVLRRGVDQMRPVHQRVGQKIAELLFTALQHFERLLPDDALLDVHAPNPAVLLVGHAVERNIEFVFPILTAGAIYQPRLLGHVQSILAEVIELLQGIPEDQRPLARHRSIGQGVIEVGVTCCQALRGSNVSLGKQMFSIFSDQSFRTVARDPVKEVRRFLSKRDEDLIDHPTGCIGVIGTVSNRELAMAHECLERTRRTLGQAHQGIGMVRQALDRCELIEQSLRPVLPYPGFELLERRLLVDFTPDMLEQVFLLVGVLPSRVADDALLREQRHALAGLLLHGGCDGEAGLLHQCFFFCCAIRPPLTCCTEMQHTTFGRLVNINNANLRPQFPRRSRNHARLAFGIEAARVAVHGCRPATTDF